MGAEDRQKLARSTIVIMVPNREIKRAHTKGKQKQRNQTKPAKRTPGDKSPLPCQTLCISTSFQPVRPSWNSIVLTEALGPRLPKAQLIHPTTLLKLSTIPSFRETRHSLQNYNGRYDQIRAFMSPDPVAKKLPCGLGATEMTEFL